MDFHSFAAIIKQQYPAYANVDDLSLVEKVIAQYPQYRSQIDNGDLTVIDNLAASSKDESVVSEAGNLVKAGGAGIADLAAGNGLNQASADINAVENEQTPGTTAAKVGTAVGGAFTPVSIAENAALGGLLDLSGFGPWITETLQGWAGNAAINAVGKIKSIAKALGVDNLDALGQFLLKPVMVGEQEFPAIVTATNSPETMLKIATDIQQAAGKQLGRVSTVVDSAISDVANSGGEALNDSPVAIDLAGLQQKIAVLKQQAVGGWEDLAPDVARKFDKALSSLETFTKEQLDGPTETTFSDLADLKTKLGNLANFGSQTESNLALQQIYGAISQTLDDAATKVGGTAGAAYNQANEVYHQISSVIEALQGKVLDARKWFDIGSLSLGAAVGAITHNPVMAAAVPAASLASRAIQNYGLQGIAQGLETAAPLVSTGFQAGLRFMPLVGNAIATGLGMGQ